MKITQVAGWTLVGVLAGCGGGTEAKTEVKTDKPEVKVPAKPEDKKPADDKKPDEAKPDDKKPDEAKPADTPAAAGGEWGIAACDNYMKTVSECKTFKMDSPVFKGITDKWKKLKDEGKTEDLEKGCSKAAELFKCPAK